LPLTKKENIFVSTNEIFYEEVKKELPGLPPKNIILEPASSERVAALLLFFCHLSEKEKKEPIAVFSLRSFD
jgi:mannose-1-phosphate guanylyltransferase